MEKIIKIKNKELFLKSVIELSKNNASLIFDIKKDFLFIKTKNCGELVQIKVDIDSEIEKKIEIHELHVITNASNYLLKSKHELILYLNEKEEMFCLYKFEGFYDELKDEVSTENKIEEKTIATIPFKTFKEFIETALKMQKLTKNKREIINVCVFSNEIKFIILEYCVLKAVTLKQKNNIKRPVLTCIDDSQLKNISQIIKINKKASNVNFLYDDVYFKIVIDDNIIYKMYFSYDKNS